MKFNLYFENGYVKIGENSREDGQTDTETLKQKSIYAVPFSLLCDETWTEWIVIVSVVSNFSLQKGRVFLKTVIEDAMSVRTYGKEEGIFEGRSYLTSSTPFASIVTALLQERFGDKVEKLETIEEIYEEFQKFNDVTFEPIS